MLEDVAVYHTMLDLICPKLLYADLPLFKALLADLFPGVQPQAAADALVRTAVEAELLEAGLQVCPLARTCGCPGVLHHCPLPAC